MTTTITASMRETALATLDEALDTDPRLAVVLADISAAQLDAERRGIRIG